MLLSGGGGGSQRLAPQAAETMGDSEEECLFSKVRSELAAATGLAIYEDSVGMASAVLKFFKLAAGDDAEWAASCLCLSSTLEELHRQSVFWHFRDFLLPLGLGCYHQVGSVAHVNPPLLELVCRVAFLVCLVLV